MADFNIYYFVIKPLNINVGDGRTGVLLEAPGQDSPVVQSIFNGFRRNLTEMMNHSKGHIPHAGSRNITIDVIPVPQQQDNPTSPDFSGLNIAIRDPIIYFTTRTNNSETGNSPDRRPEYVLMDALQQSNCEEFPDSWISEQRSVLNGAGELSGLSLPGIPGISYPVTACVFSDARQNFEASNWQQLLSHSLACAAFHEIAHCKTETDNRTHNPRWSDAITGSMHSVSNVQILARNGVGQNPSSADYQLMGEHMLCPINFYRLDQSIDDQCFSEGQIAALTPRP